LSTNPNFTPYTQVLVILKREGQADIDFSQAWSTIEYRDAGPQSVKITLNSAFGKFMTVAPIIVKYDKFYVRVIDARGGTIEDVFHVRKIKRGRQSGKNKQLILFCPHQSENFWKRTISLVAKRTSGFEALNQLVEILDLPQNKGTNDPDVEVPTNNTLKKVGNFLDPNTSNNYIFEAVKLQTAVDEIRDIEQQPIEGGGSFEAIFVRFKSKYNHAIPSDTDLNTVQLQAFPQGFQDDGTASNTLTNIPNVTLIHQPTGSTATPPTNILTFDSDEDPELATNLLAIADRNSGSYLPNWMQFQGAKDVFDNVKDWVTGMDYIFGNLVRELGITYECILDHLSSGANQPPNATFWIVRTFTKPGIWNFGTAYVVNDLVIRVNTSWKCIQAHTADNVNEPPNSAFWTRIFFAPAVDYSPQTKADAQLWVNAMAGSQFADGGASDANQAKVCVVDPNVFVDDTLHPRTLVRIVTDDPVNIPTIHLIAGVDIPDAYRVLAIDPATGAAPTAGIWGPGLLDKNGVLLGGNILEWIDTDLDGTGEWVVFKSKVLGDDQEIFDHNRAEPWVKNPCIPVFTLGLPDRFVNNAGACTFALGGSAPRATVWTIGSYSIQQVALVGQFGVFHVNRQVECAHSVKWDTTNHHIDVGNTKIIADDTDGDSAVFIKSEPNLIDQIPIIGDGTDANPFFVGANIHALNPLTGQDDSVFAGSGAAGSVIALPTFDFNNMFRDHFGVRSWFGPQTEDLLPIQKFAFWMQYLVTRNPISALFNLTEGDFGFKIWLADRRDNVRIIELNQPRKDDIFPQEGQLPGEPYKGVPGASTFFSAQQPDTTAAFDPREFLIGGIMSSDSFDGQGRYEGLKSRYKGATELEIRIDGYRMTKPLSATNADVLQDKPTRNITTQFIKKPGIVSYAQLKNLILGLDKIFNFERKEFKEGTGGRCDVQWGDSVYYTDSEEINETVDSLSNTIKGVNTENVISLSKSKLGPGGFTSTFSLVNRIWPD